GRRPCRAWFGGGQVTRPVEFVLGDRATFEVDGTRLPIEETARGAIDSWLAQHLPRLRPHVETRVALAPGSAQLRNTFGAEARAVLSNDTSGACGYAPLSATEATVLAVEQFLNGADFKA